MQAIVHIGMPKTGTTALQESLSNSAAYLAERGLLYPDNPPGSGSSSKHRLLLALIMPFGSLPRRMNKRGPLTRDNLGDKLDGFLRHLRIRIDQQRPGGLILSAEGLFATLPDDRHATFRACFSELGAQPRFVAYLRSPSEHYLSSMQQRLKASAIVKPPRTKNYRRVLESYETCFGPDAVSARLFHRDHLENRDIVADFCRHALADFQVDPARLTPGGKANETLSAESMDVLRRYRLAFHPDRDDVFTKDTNTLRAALLEADRRIGAARPRLHPDLAEALDYASHDALWLRDRFGVTFPGLDYGRIAAGPTVEPRRDGTDLEDLLVIDRTVQTRILESVAPGPWAAGDAARQAWLDALLRSLPGRRGGPLPLAASR